MEKLELLQKMIDECSNIVFFGGAGVSTESGIKDFRSPDGLYNAKTKYSAEYMLSREFLENHPEEFYEFYRSSMNSLGAKPNITHEYLKKLEDKGKLQAIITQNIDGLHTKAGNKKVYEIHGTIYQNHCLKCHKFYSAEYLFDKSNSYKCACGGLIKPDVVLYGEALPDCFEEAIYFITKAEMLIVAGTSLTVEPASSLVRLFNGKYLVILNKTATSYDNLANLVIHDSLSNIFNKLS